MYTSLPVKKVSATDWLAATLVRILPASVSVFLVAAFRHCSSAAAASGPVVI